MSTLVGIGWPPPPRHPPGQAMNSMNWHWLNWPPALMSSMTLAAFAVPCTTATFRVTPRSQFQSGTRWASRPGTGPTSSGMVISAYLAPANPRTGMMAAWANRSSTLSPVTSSMTVRGFEGAKYAEITIPDEVGPVPGLLAHLVPDWNWLRGVTLKVAVVHGTANAAKVMEDIKAGGQFSQCQSIEFMACPGGCLGGGGQPIPTNVDIRTARAKAIYAEDAHYGETGRARKSHENPAVLRLYGEFLTDGPCGHTSHHLLHTEYTARGTFIDASARSTEESTC